MSLRRGLNTSIVVDPEVRTIIEKYLAVTKESYEIYDAEEREVYRIQQEQERKAREEKLEKEKFEKRKQAALQKLNSIKPEQTSRLFKTPTSQYEVLGCMAKHTKSIKASIPDYMANRFVKIFGQEADRYVVDSTKRTSGGHPMQWSLSCRINFDTEVPSLLLNKVAANKKVIDSVAFVWDLIDNYGSKAMVDVKINVVPIILENKTLFSSGLKEKYGINIMFLKRDEEALEVDKDTIVQNGDVAVVFGPYQSIKNIFLY
jgi:hypothetical protein